MIQDTGTRESGNIKPTRDVSHICLSPGTLGDGGIGMVMLGLASSFLRMGLKVDLVFTGSQHMNREKAIPPEVSIFHLASHARYAITPAIRYMRERKPDVIVTAHNHIYILMLMARSLACTGNYCRIVHTFHTNRELDTVHGGVNNRVYDWIATRMHNKADHLVACSGGVARHIERLLCLPGGAVSVIHNPAWSDELAQRAREEFNEPWLVHKTCPVIIGMGRLTRQKDFHTLICAFSKLKRRINARLIILGDGEDRAMLEQLITTMYLSDCVRLPGFMSNPLPLLSRADLFVLSSRWEGFGNVLVEALGCGLPIVSTDCSFGPSEILDNGRLGELVPVGSHDLMAAAMERALVNPPNPLRQKMAAESFTYERSAKKYMEVFSCLQS